MWLRMRFDIGWSDVAFGARSLAARLDREALKRQIGQCWPQPQQMFPCLSVRTGFDLLWKSLELPVGSEVLMSAMTIPDKVPIHFAFALNNPWDYVSNPVMCIVWH